MESHVDLMCAVYRVVVRRMRAARPLYSAYDEDHWRLQMERAGMSAADAACRARWIGDELMSEFAAGVPKGAPERVAMVNAVFQRGGLTPEMVERPKPAQVQVSESGDHYVYRLYDSLGKLLYVGISQRGPARLVEHYRAKPWFPEVTRVEFERYPTRDLSAAREEHLIKTLHPRYNVIFNSAVTTAA